MESKTLVTYLLLVLTLFDLNIVQVHAKRSLFGEPCSLTGQKCDKRFWLSCHNNSTCSCVKPEVMTYDPAAGKCVVKSGEQCKFLVDEKDNRQDANLFEVMPCVENAECSREGFCTCGPRFFEHENGTCVPAPRINEPCDPVARCASADALYCSQGKCICDESKSVYVKGHGGQPKCVGFPGEPCINNICPDHSTCHRDSTNQISVCLCNPDFYHDILGKTCRPQKGVFEPCAGDGECAVLKGVQLVCLDGACSCNSSTSIYGTARKQRKDSWNWDRFSDFKEPEKFTQCLGLAGLKCLDRLCAPNAHCQYDNQQRSYSGGLDGGLGLGGDGGISMESLKPKVDPDSGTCICDQGYAQSHRGTCAHGYGQSCKNNRDCIDGLICKDVLNGVAKNYDPSRFHDLKCQCPYPDQTFDPLKQSCISKIDGPCDSIKVKGTCGPHAECIFSSHQESIRSNITATSVKVTVDLGHCTCKKGFVPNMEGACDIAFGQPCGPAAATTDMNALSCDRLANLTCINEKCGCSAFASYSETFGQCRGLVGAPCDLTLVSGEGDDEELVQCVENSFCTRVHPNRKLPGRCQCQLGFVETPGYTCEMSKEFVVVDDSNFINRTSSLTFNFVPAKVNLSESVN